MTRLDRVLAIVQAGGRGGRMDVLTRERAKPALGFGGEYQLIDFALSSLAHTGIPDVWVCVQYLAASLDYHLAGGRPWDLDRTHRGYRRLVPEEGRGPTETGFSQGNADSLVRVWREIQGRDPELIVVVSADHVFNMDLRDAIDAHRERGAEGTLITAAVSQHEARQKAVVEVGDDDRVTRVEYKPDAPRSDTVATEIFIYDGPVLGVLLGELRAELSHQADDPHDTGLGDFGEHLLPRLVERGRVYAVPMTGYWRDLGRPESYLAGHHDLIDGKVDVFAQKGRPVLTRRPPLMPARLRGGALADEAVLSSGCDIAGEVNRSVLGPGVVVERGASIQDSVIGAGVLVEAGAHVHTSIVDDDCVIGRGARVGAAPRRRPADDDQITLVGVDSRIAPGATVGAGARLEPGTLAD